MKKTKENSRLFNAKIFKTDYAKLQRIAERDDETMSSMFVNWIRKLK